MMIESVSRVFSRVHMLWRTRTPLRVWVHLPTGLLTVRLAKIRFKNESILFHQRIQGKKFSQFWFLDHYPVWVYIFKRTDFKPKTILEIGSWEGLSTLFLTEHFPDAQLICVDTWEGSEENAEVPAHLLGRFQSNLSAHSERITPFLGKSREYFSSVSKTTFDLVFIDGSHESKDVALDGREAWGNLNIGGVMIFDDYFWNYYDDVARNPMSAVNEFVARFSKEVEILHVGYQVFLKKREVRSG